jgi:hypothetical protein
MGGTILLSVDRVYLGRELIRSEAVCCAVEPADVELTMPSLSYAA